MNFPSSFSLDFVRNICNFNFFHFHSVLDVFFSCISLILWYFYSMPFSYSVHEFNKRADIFFFCFAVLSNTLQKFSVLLRDTIFISFQLGESPLFSNELRMVHKLTLWPHMKWTTNMKVYMHVCECEWCIDVNVIVYDDGVCFTLIEGSATEIWCIVCLCISYEQGNNCKRCEKKHNVMNQMCFQGEDVIEYNSSSSSSGDGGREKKPRTYNVHTVESTH